jgi:tRNA-uridine 2-sulfurtransferase
VRVLVAMSGGVDSSVAAALLVGAGHEVVGATMKLWGGDSDSGCCSIADVEDARRVAQQLGIAHHVFNFTDDFDARVVSPYVEAHAAGLTPNPCVECNRHLKFDRFLRRARQLGFDAIATGHHARVVDGHRLVRGVDRAKDQSYVLSMLTRPQLEGLLLPVGELTKAEVRARATAIGLRTADKPDSQDVCFITATGGRSAFLGDRIPLHPGRLVDAESGADIGVVEAVELVTIGQRRGMSSGAGTRRYAVEIDVPGRRVVVGEEHALLSGAVTLTRQTWVDEPLGDGLDVVVQVSAHGVPIPSIYDSGVVQFAVPQRRVAPGQTVALYVGDEVVGSGVAA